MFDSSTWLDDLWIILGAGVLVWVGLPIRTDASLVDRFWSRLFVAGFTVATQDPEGPPRTVVLVTGWGLRLAIYLTWRNWSKGEDHRYLTMREQFGARRFLLISLP